MKKILQILSVFLLSCLAVVLFGVVNHQEAKASGPWACITNGGNKAAWQNSGVIKACDDFFVYDPTLSGAAGQPVFVSGKDAGSDDGNHHPVFQMTLAKDASGNLGYSLKDAAGQTTSGDFIEQNNLASVPFVATDTKKEFCSIIKSTDCDPYNGDKVVVQDGTLDGGHAGGFGFSTDHYNGAGIDGAAYVDAANKQDTKDKLNNSDCIDNPLSFFLCPLYRAIAESVDGLTNFLTDQLTIESLSSQNTGSGGGLVDGFNRLRNVANSLYILIFLIIIFSNFVNFGLQNYTIKKLLPKLIAAIIITQFGFLICTLMIDLSNVLLAAIPSLVQGANPKSLGESIQSNFLQLVGQQGTTGAGAALNGLVTGVAYFVLILLLAIVALVIILIALGYIVFRNIFLIVLVFLSPVAIAAWVLPGTEKFAKKWAIWFIKLLLMGPIIGLILSIVVVVQQIFQNSNNKFLLAVSVFVPFVGLLIIPKSFKWSGDVMSATKDLAKNSAVGKKATESYKENGAVGNLSGKAMQTFGGKVPGRFGEKAALKGANKQAAYKSKQRENYENLGLDDLIAFSNSGNKRISDNAKGQLAKKQADLSNQRILTAGQADQLNKILLNQGQPGILTSNQRFNKDTGLIETVDSSGNVTASDATITNPLWNGGGQTGPQQGTGTNQPTPSPTPGGGGSTGGGNGTPAPTAAPGGTGTSGTATPGTGAGPGQARSSAAQALRGARAGRAATGSTAAPLSNPNAAPPPNPAGGPPGGGAPPTPPPAGGPPGFPGP